MGMQAHGRTRIRYATGESAEDSALLREFATEIYEKAFHDKHREPTEAWMGRLTCQEEEPEQHATLLLGEGRTGGEVLGGALSETYRSGIVLLTYVAVRESERGRGHGSTLMKEVRRRHRGATLMAEMVDPDRAAEEDREEARRRAAVFARWGWRAVGCAYHQPQLSPADAWASDLLLLHHGPLKTLQAHIVEDLNAGLRSSLGAGEAPAGATHRWPPETTYRPEGLIPTYKIPGLSGA